MKGFLALPLPFPFLPLPGSCKKGKLQFIATTLAKAIYGKGKEKEFISSRELQKSFKEKRAENSSALFPIFQPSVKI